MSLVGHIVGSVFENLVGQEFSTLAHNSIGSLLPDYTNSWFGLECKGAGWQSGCPIKQEQIYDHFPKFGFPVVYAFGYHTLQDIAKFNKRKFRSVAVQYLSENLNFNHRYYVSDTIVRKFWENEHFTQKKAEQTNPKYFKVKPRHIESVINDTPFVRRGVEYWPDQYYNIELNDYIRISCPKEGGRGFLLHRVRDANAVDFFVENKLLAQSMLSDFGGE